MGSEESEVKVGHTVIPVFPSLLFIHDVPEYKELLPVVQNLKNNDPTGLQMSNMGGWHSQFQRLPDIIQRQIPFPKYKGNCWYMVNTNLQGNYSHTHPGNDWSGVLWLKVPEEEAKLEFEHPDLFAQFDTIKSVTNFYPQLQEQFNYFNAYSFVPVEGKMIIFPSSLRHRVYYSTTDEERISLSFNIKVDYD